MNFPSKEWIDVKVDELKKSIDLQNVDLQRHKFQKLYKIRKRNKTTKTRVEELSPKKPKDIYYLAQ